jgi:hypothetical protein
MLSLCTVALKVSSFLEVKLRPLLIEVVTFSSGIAARSATESAVYSDSIVDVAIHGCNLEHHITEHPMTSMMNPVQDFTESGLDPNSIPQPLAKAASTYTSILNTDSLCLGRRIRPLLMVPFR